MGTREQSNKVRSQNCFGSASDFSFLSAYVETVRGSVGSFLVQSIRVLKIATNFVPTNACNSCCRNAVTQHDAFVFRLEGPYILFIASESWCALADVRLLVVDIVMVMLVPLVAQFLYLIA